MRLLYIYVILWNCFFTAFNNNYTNGKCYLKKPFRAKLSICFPKSRDAILAFNKTEIDINKTISKAMTIINNSIKLNDSMFVAKEIAHPEQPLTSDLNFKHVPLNDLPSFNEWKHQVKEVQREIKYLQNNDEFKTQLKLNKENDIVPAQDISNGKLEVDTQHYMSNDSNFSKTTVFSNFSTNITKETNILDEKSTHYKAPIEDTKNNYAASSCGAKILHHNSEALNVNGILQKNLDEYMLNPCSAQIWFTLELCEPIQIKTIELANMELFSSSPKEFRIFISDRYPTKEWLMNTTFIAQEGRKHHIFNLETNMFARYIKFELLSHYGTEHYCPLTFIRVYGTNLVEELVPDEEIDVERLNEDQINHAAKVIEDKKLKDVENGDSLYINNKSAKGSHSLPLGESLEPSLAPSKGLLNNLDKTAQQAFDGDHETTGVIQNTSAPQQFQSHPPDDTVEGAWFLQENFGEAGGGALKGDTANETISSKDLTNKEIPSNIITSAKNAVVNILNHASNALVPQEILYNGANARGNYKNILINRSRLAPFKISIPPTVEQPKKTLNNNNTLPKPSILNFWFPKFCACCQRINFTNIAFLEIPKSSACFYATIYHMVTNSESLSPACSICLPMIGVLNTSKITNMPFTNPQSSTSKSLFEDTTLDGNLQIINNVTASNCSKGNNLESCSNSTSPDNFSNNFSSKTGNLALNGTTGTANSHHLLTLVSSHKESIFMRLNNRLRALESNLTLTARYLDELSRSYVRSLEDNNANFDKISKIINASSLYQTQKHNQLLSRIEILELKLSNALQTIEQHHGKIGYHPHSFFPFNKMHLFWLWIHISILVIQIAILGLSIVWLIPLKVSRYFRNSHCNGALPAPDPNTHMNNNYPGSSRPQHNIPSTSEHTIYQNIQNDLLLPDFPSLQQQDLSNVNRPNSILVKTHGKNYDGLFHIILNFADHLALGIIKASYDQIKSNKALPKWMDFLQNNQDNAIASNCSRTNGKPMIKPHYSLMNRCNNHCAAPGYPVLISDVHKKDMAIMENYSFNNNKNFNVSYLKPISQP